jgi:hypothetical protein
MGLRGGLLAVALLATPAAASQASWPITVSVTYPVALTAGAGVARVDVLIGANARAVDIEVWGLDGMRAGDDNIVSVTRDQTTVGTRIDFDVLFHPGPGRSSLVVSAKAVFAGAGAGVTVLDFPYGAENADQFAEHSACVRQDPEGVWIRLDNCDKTAAAGPPVLTVAELKAARPVGSRAILTGYVAGSYLCPPCPKVAMCKPCAGPSAVYIADASGHAAFDLARPPADVAVLSASNPTAFPSGAAVRLEVEVSDRAATAFDGVIVARAPFESIKQ